MYLPESEPPFGLDGCSPLPSELLPLAHKDLISRVGHALSIAENPYGQPVSNEQLLQMATNHGLPLTDLKTASELIAATGFTRRFMSHFPDHPLEISATVDRSARIGARLLRETTTALGWNNPDLVIDTSAFLPLNLSRELLDYAGLNPQETASLSYRYACSGAVAAFIDCLADPNLIDKKIVIVAADPLSALIHPEHLQSLSGLIAPAIFGDGFAALAFNPRHFRLLGNSTRVIPDGGVIKFPTYYDFAGSAADVVPPSHYQIDPQDETILKWTTQTRLAKIIYPDKGIAEVDGVNTGLFFGDHASKLLIDLLNQIHQPHLLQELKPPGQDYYSNLFLHPASRPVVNRQAKKLLLADIIKGRNLPFCMDSFGRSNSSSATSLVNMLYQIELGRLDPRLPIVIAAPGVSSIIASAVLEISPDHPF